MYSTNQQPTPTPDLKTSLWVSAHVRICFNADTPAFIAAKGDPDRGGVLLKINKFSEGVTLLERSRDFDGKRIWREVAVGADERDVDVRIQKKCSFDEDLWVIEIEDMHGRYSPDAPVLGD